MAESVRYFDEVYAKLGVLLTDDDIVGESFYNPMLADVVDDLDALGLLVESDGARCVFPPGFTNREGDPLPLIVQKSDGGYGYAATDLAAIRDRVDRIGATRILYVVGAPQAQHLQMCFAVAAMAGLAARRRPGRPRLLRQRPRRRPQDVQDPARATRSSWSTSWTRPSRGPAPPWPSERPDIEPATSATEVARALGIGAIKYADLSTDRTRDYVFDWDRMLAFEGNTGPYLQYAHARIRSIFRRGEVAVPEPTVPPDPDRAPTSGPWPCGLSASPRRSPRRPSRARRPSSAPTSSTWPPPSPPSTRTARC